MGLFDVFRSKGPSAATLLQQNALVVDVRTPAEYRTGHVKGSRNVPLDRLQTFVRKEDPEARPIVTCCASGMRSGRAAKVLKKAGFTVANGGAWSQVERLQQRPS